MFIVIRSKLCGCFARRSQSHVRLLPGPSSRTRQIWKSKSESSSTGVGRDLCGSWYLFIWRPRARRYEKVSGDKFGYCEACEVFFRVVVPCDSVIVLRDVDAEIVTVVGTFVSFLLIFYFRQLTKRKVLRLALWS